MEQLTRRNNDLPPTPMEVMLGIDENKMTSARKLYAYLQHDPTHFSRWAKINIEDNEFATENEDYLRVAIEGETPTGGKIERIDYKLHSHFAKKLAMQAQNERGEEARTYYVSVEENSQALVTSLGDLSPQLKHLISVELRMKKVEEDTQKANERLDEMCDVIALNPIDWRSETAAIINRIAEKIGGYEHIKPIRNEIYKALEARFAVDLGRRLSNKRRRMAEEGTCKSKRERLNQLDVIAGDKKLIEGYVSIVKEAAIKNGVGV